MSLVSGYISQPLAGLAAALPYEFDLISPSRQDLLRQLAGVVMAARHSGGPAELVFICTHNSRRSLMAQIWAQVAAYHHHIASVHTYSGGTEATAFNQRSVVALQKAGLTIQIALPGGNPVFDVVYSSEKAAVVAFSKKYNHQSNPNHGFLAVMTCTQADEACPVVFGAKIRLSIPYEDPKDFDNTALEIEKYDERCRQIAREMFFAFSNVS